RPGRWRSRPCLTRAGRPVARRPGGGSRAPGTAGGHRQGQRAVEPRQWCCGSTPFAAVLVGQPILRRRIKLGTFAALDQRIALRYAMTGMTREETTGYVRHHLELVGRSDTLFTDDALALIHQVSRGLPRAVNNLAVQALVAAYATNKTVVDESSARA